jgi:hypothetical protein
LSTGGKAAASSWKVVNSHQRPRHGCTSGAQAPPLNHLSVGATNTALAGLQVFRSRLTYIIVPRPGVPLTASILDVYSR